jgi:hypothetical protein
MMKHARSNPTVLTYGLAVWVVAACLVVGGEAAALSGIATRALCNELPKAPSDTSAAPAAREAGDAAFALRADAAQADAAIVAYGRSLAADPSQVDVRVRLSRLHYLLGDGRFRFAEKDEAQLAAFEQGMRHAATALATVNPAFRSRICSGASLDDAMAVLDRSSVAPLYWFATHLGKYGLAKDLLEVLANKDMIFRAMSRIRELDAGYFYSAPDRYLGAYWTKVPFPAGDLPRALAHFQVSMRGERGYFATYVLVAELYVLKAKANVTKDARFCRLDSAAGGQGGACKRLYAVLLEHVIKAKNTLPEIEAEQAVEREKARLLLEELDTYFPS